MIICIDVGNTNIKYAIFDGDALKFSFRVATDLKRTSDEYGSQLIGMLEFNGLRADDITGGIFSRAGSFPPSCLPSITPSSTCSKCI